MKQERILAEAQELNEQLNTLLFQWEEIKDLPYSLKHKHILYQLEKLISNDN